MLPATGETEINLLTIGGGLLLVLGISLVGKGKKKGSGKEVNVIKLTNLSRFVVG
ncbi:LPXTG cell wall anchor domain-containing protein [Streptococcus suis]|uniref:LPXTG cell wall anchor domain-containing protein n=1 Tax=Streptococcus suis TaxID=1307 RepID=UPI0037CA2673